MLHKLFYSMIDETQRELLRLMSDDRVNPIYSIIQQYPGINTPKIAELVGKSIPTVSRGLEEHRKRRILCYLQHQGMNLISDNITNTNND